MDKMLDAWAKMQQRIWDGWRQAAAGFEKMHADCGGDTERRQDEYRQNLEAWEKAVREVLDAQTEWVNLWLQQAESEPEDEESEQELRDLLAGWLQAQTQLWDAWFASVRRLDPSQPSDRRQREEQQVMQAWQEALERVQETLRALPEQERIKSRRRSMAPGGGSLRSRAGRSSVN